MDARELRNAFGRFATGVTVVTCTSQDGEPHGATVNAFTAVSLDPPLAQVTLARQSKACSYLDGAPFSINVLADDQLDTAWHFAGKPSDPGPIWADGPAGPYIVGSATTMSCRPWRTYDGGDHLIVIGEVVAVDVTDREPLVFHGGQFRNLEAPRTGAHWDGSIDSPESGWFDAKTVFTTLDPSRHTATRLAS